MSESKTDEAIRMLLQENGHRPSGRRSGRDKLPPLAEPEATAVEEVKKRDSRMHALLSPYVLSVKSYRPTAKHIALFAFALLVFFRPWLVFWVITMVIVVLTIIYFSLGPDAVAEKIARAYNRYAARRPEAAEKLKARASGLIDRFGSLLDKLPPRWTEGLYLPDLDGTQQTVMDAQPDPFDRLSDKPQNT